MIDWGAFLLVAVVALVAAAALVALYASGLRLMAWSHSGSSLTRTKRVGAIACFTACALLVLFGIYLIVPALHGG